MVINKYLDETLPLTEENLKFLKVNCDEVVWKLATKIYSESGHKIELTVVRDIVNSKISAMKHQLSAEAEEKARQTIQEARLLADKEANFRNQVAHSLTKFGGDQNKAYIFVKIRQILCELFELDENEITEETRVFSFDLYMGGGLSCVPKKITDYKVEESSKYYKVFISDLGNGDEQDFLSIYYALEEEFDIEIQDEEAEELCTECATLKDVVEYIAKKCDR